MATERIDIVIQEQGSKVVKRNLEDIGDTAKKSADGLDLLKKALAGVLAFLAIDKVKQYADAWSAAAGQIAIATKSTNEAKTVTEQLFAAAQRTRVGFSDVVDLYSRAARAGSDLGASQAQIIKFTEGVGKALAVQHTSSTQASGALLQLGQALGGAKIQAQEFNSLIDGAPVILQTVARGMDATGGSIGKLTQMVKSGQVSNKQFFEAFLKGSAQLDEDFAKSVTTIGQGFIVIDNAITKYIGELNESIGASKAFGAAARFIAENIDQIATIALSVGAALAVAFAPAVIFKFMQALQALFTLIYSNPFIALAAAIAAATVYLARFGDEMDAGIDGVTSVNDVLRAFGEAAVAAFGVARAAAGEFFTWLGGIASTAFQAVTSSTDQATKDWANSYSQFYQGVGTGFAGILKAVARTFDAIGGLLIGFYNAVVATFSAIPTLLIAPFKMAYNAVLTTMEDLSNVVIGKINEVRKAVGKDPIELVKFDKAEFADAGKSFGEIFNEGFQSQGGALEKFVDDQLKRAEQIGKDRLAAVKTEAPADLTKPIGKPTQFTDPQAEKALEKLQNQLRSLLNTIYPVDGAMLEMKKAQDILTQSVEKGLISREKEAQYLELVKLHYQDVIDPIGKLNREMDQQTKLLGMSADAREVESQMMSIQQDLQNQGIILSAAESAAIRERLVAMQDLNKVVQAQDALLSNSVKQREGFTTQLQAIQALLADPSSGFTKGDATDALASQNQDLFAGTQEQLDAQMARFQTMYDQIDQMRQADLISEQTAQQMRAKVQAETSAVQLNNAQQFFGNLAVLSKSGNSKIAAIGRAAAVTQATIDGVLAVQKALASAPPPVNYALAAAVGVSAAANVAQIAGLGFKTGGDFVVGGAGGQDSQMVAFRATPGEKVSIATPRQVRKGDPNTKDAQAQQQNGQNGLRIINLVDPALLEDFMNTPAGEQVLINTMRRNPAAIQDIVRN